MLVFVDESGDPGMKLSSGSSRLFVVGLVVFDDRDEAQRCDDAISELRCQLYLPEAYEFHYSHNSKRIREKFLDAASSFSFKAHIFALDKKLVTGSGFQYKDSLYKWTANTVFQNAKNYLKDATVVLDKCGDRTFRDELAAYLRKRINKKGGPTHIKKVKLEASDRNNLLQLADYVVGVSSGVFQGNQFARDMDRRYLRSHVMSRRRWPK